jgi:glucose/arabinose dehydrogenase
MRWLLHVGLLALAACGACTKTKPSSDVAAGPLPPVGTLLTSDLAKGDWTTDAPGTRRKITPADLPSPYATPSADNGPRVVARPAGALPLVPSGFVVSLFASGLANPRQIRTAPNGDLFIVESAANRVRVVRDSDGDGTPEVVEIFAEGLNQPFGVAFYPPGAATQWVYVANTDSVVRFPYVDGDVKARGQAEVIVNDLSGGGLLRGGGHWTRDVVFSRDGTKMWVSIGSRSNVSDDASEARRARIFEYSPDGKSERVYATGLRNPVGLAVNPANGDLWTTVNERDELGDHLVPDYVTRVGDGAFFGWPWFYIGGNWDPRHAGAHPELRATVAVPDVLFQSHSASLGVTFYEGQAFPPEYRGEPFVALHGSWNRARRTGYKVVRVPLGAGAGGAPLGEYVDFMTGFVLPNGDVWGRPVGVAETKEGALVVTDDGGNCLWRVAFPR